MVVFSTRIFQNLDLGIECVLKWKAMKLELLRCIIPSPHIKNLPTLISAHSISIMNAPSVIKEQS